jgi:hypothetical protein
MLFRRAWKNASSRGYTLQAAYTWSKFMEPTGFLNDASPRPEEVISDQDYPHRLTVSAIWELPFGRGRKFGAEAHPVLDKLIGGWQARGSIPVRVGKRWDSATRSSAAI